jgi:DNA-binding LacI/PurR family transcriptional regulator
MANVSIKSIAELAGVSSATVSRCLDPRYTNSVLEKKRKKILDIQKHLGYETNVFARKLRRQCTETITLVLPLDAFKNPIYPDFSGHNYKLTLEIINGISMEAQKCGYDMKMLHLFDDKPETLENMVSKVGFPHSDGVILLGIYGLEKCYSAINEKQVPVIVAGTHIAEMRNITQVVSDSQDAVNQAMRHLYEKGHRKIAFAAVSDYVSYKYLKIPPAEQRFISFRNTLMYLHIYDENLIFKFENEIAVRRWLAENHGNLPFTALFCCNDAMAFRFIRELEVLNLSVPRDLAVIGYDNNSVYADDIGLSTIAIPYHEIGCEALKTIVQIIETKRNINRNVIIPAKFIRGRTS